MMSTVLDCFIGYCDDDDDDGDDDDDDDICKSICQFKCCPPVNDDQDESDQLKDDKDDHICLSWQWR